MATLPAVFFLNMFYWMFDKLAQFRFSSKACHMTIKMSLGKNIKSRCLYYFYISKFRLYFTDIAYFEVK